MTTNPIAENIVLAKMKHAERVVLDLDSGDELIRAFVAREAGRGQCSLDAMLFPLLAGVSSCMRRSGVIHVDDLWREFPILWTVVAGRRGERSATFPIDRLKVTFHQLERAATAMLRHKAQSGNTCPSRCGQQCPAASPGTSKTRHGSRGTAAPGAVGDTVTLLKKKTETVGGFSNNIDHTDGTPGYSLCTSETSPDPLPCLRAGSTTGEISSQSSTEMELAKDCMDSVLREEPSSKCPDMERDADSSSVSGVVKDVTSSNALSASTFDDELDASKPNKDPHKRRVDKEPGANDLEMEQDMNEIDHTHVTMVMDAEEATTTTTTAIITTTASTTTTAGIITTAGTTTTASVTTTASTTTIPATTSRAVQEETMSQRELCESQGLSMAASGLASTEASCGRELTSESECAVLSRSLYDVRENPTEKPVVGVASRSDTRGLEGDLGEPLLDLHCACARRTSGACEDRPTSLRSTDRVVFSSRLFVDESSAIDLRDHLMSSVQYRWSQLPAEPAASCADDVDVLCLLQCQGMNLRAFSQYCESSQGCVRDVPVRAYLTRIYDGVAALPYHKPRLCVAVSIPTDELCRRILANSTNPPPTSGAHHHQLLLGDCALLSVTSDPAIRLTSRRAKRVGPGLPNDSRIVSDSGGPPSPRLRPPDLTAVLDQVLRAHAGAAHDIVYTFSEAATTALTSHFQSLNAMKTSCDEDSERRAHISRAEIQLVRVSAVLLALRNGIIMATECLEQSQVCLQIGSDIVNTAFDIVIYSLHQKCSLLPKSSNGTKLENLIFESTDAIKTRDNCAPQINNQSEVREPKKLLKQKNNHISVFSVTGSESGGAKECEKNLMHSNTKIVHHQNEPIHSEKNVCAPQAKRQRPNSPDDSEIDSLIITFPADATSLKGESSPRQFHEQCGSGSSHSARVSNKGAEADTKKSISYEYQNLANILNDTTYLSLNGPLKQVGLRAPVDQSVGGLNMGRIEDKNMANMEKSPAAKNQTKRHNQSTAQHNDDGVKNLMDKTEGLKCPKQPGMESDFLTPTIKLEPEDVDNSSGSSMNNFFSEEYSFHPQGTVPIPPLNPVSSNHNNVFESSSTVSRTTITPASSLPVQHQITPNTLDIRQQSDEELVCHAGRKIYKLFLFPHLTYQLSTMCQKRLFPPVPAEFRGSHAYSTTHPVWAAAFFSFRLSRLGMGNLAHPSTRPQSIVFVKAPLREMGPRARWALAAVGIDENDYQTSYEAADTKCLEGLVPISDSELETISQGSATYGTCAKAGTREDFKWHVPC